MIKRFLLFILVIIILLYGTNLVFRYFILEPYKYKVDNSVKGSYKKLSKGYVYYEIHGKGNGELVVMIHGGGVAGSFVWRKNINFLIDQGYRILVYDLYDRGYSERIDEKSNLDVFYNQLNELLISLKIERPFHLVSLSMGALIAVEYVSENPQKIKSLILISPALQGSFKKRKILDIPLLRELVLTFYWSPRSVSQQKKEFYDPSKADEYFIELEKFKKYRGYIHSNLYTWLNIMTIDYVDQLSSLALKTPVLAIFGKNDFYVPPEVAEIYKSKSSQIQTVIIDNAGHMPQYEQESIANTKIFNFLSNY